jgi:CTP synthase (UTP-ammonia lyase)
MRILNDFNTTVEKALSEIDPRWREYEGLIVCGSHTPFGTEQIIRDIREARETGLPFLGICFGHQLAWIEYCRNVLGIEKATSEEFGDGICVVQKRKELKVGLHEGETWWSNYECVGDEDWKKPENFFTAPFHPEYQSSKDKPHPLLINFLKYAKMAM